MLCALLLLLLLATPPPCRGLEVEVGRGQELCYHQPVARGETITVQYEVAAASGHTANTDIDFRLVRPGGEAVVVEYRRQAGHHEFAGGLLGDGAGDYTLCLDNRFSLFSAKQVVFSVTVAPAAGESVQSYLREVRDSVAEEYQDRAEEVAGLLLAIRQRVTEAGGLQGRLQLAHARDLSLADRNLRRVDAASLVLVTLIVLAGLLQAYAIREMFTLKL